MLSRPIKSSTVPLYADDITPPRHRMYDHPRQEKECRVRYLTRRRTADDVSKLTASGAATTSIKRAEESSSLIRLRIRTTIKIYTPVI